MSSNPEKNDMDFSVDGFPEQSFPEPVVPETAKRRTISSDALDEQPFGSGWIKHNGDWVFVPTAEDLDEIENAGAADEVHEAPVEEAPVAAGRYFQRKAVDVDDPVEEPTQFIDTGEAGNSYVNDDESIEDGYPDAEDDYEDDYEDEDEYDGRSSNKKMVVTMVVLLLALLAMVGLFLYSYLSDGNGDVAENISQIFNKTTSPEDEEELTAGANMTTVVNGVVVTIPESTTSGKASSDKTTASSDKTTASSDKTTASSGGSQGTTRATSPAKTTDPDIEDIISEVDGGKEEGDAWEE